MVSPSLLDIDKICRVCLRCDQEMFLIFDEKYAEDQNHNLATMLSECTKYLVQRFDDLPHLICGGCMEAVRNAYRLKRTCEQSYRQLIKLLGSGDSDNTNPPSYALKMESNEHADKSTQTDASTMYPCERCDQKFFDFECLRTHRENEHKGSAIECRFCSKTFNRIGYLKTHIAIFHPGSGYRSHNQCNICKRQFTRREHMRRHLAVIHKIVEPAEDETVEDELEEEAELAMEDLEKLPATTNSELVVIASALQLPPEDGAADIKVKAEPVLTLPPHREEQEFLSGDEDSDSGSENRTRHLYGGPTLMDSDDEDEQPLSNFINAAPIKADFIEVLLNESGSNGKEAKEENFLDGVKSTDKASPILEADILSTKKRGRGRPRRVIKREPSSSASASSGEEQEYKCGVCDKVLQRRATLERHQLNHIEEKPIPCKLCSRRFRREDYLKSHMNSYHDASKVMKCEECDIEFTHITQFKRHKETKHAEKSHKCEICEKKFTTKIYLQRHMAVHEKKRYMCKECSLNFLTRQELNGHIKTAGHDKPMLCPECGLRCKTSNILMVHMRRHNGEKPFKCKFCSKGFPRMDDLRVHEKYHTGEKSHFCETCGKGFQRKYNLTIHLRVHTGEKPYKCPHCPQAFAQGNDLKAHIRRHTGERFRCEVCGAAFLQGYQIRQHKLTEHGIKEEPPTQRVAKFTSPEEQEQQIKQNLQKELSLTMDTTEDCTSNSVEQPSEADKEDETIQDFLMQ